MAKIILLILLAVLLTGCRSRPVRKQVYYVTITDQTGEEKFLSSCGKPEIVLKAGQYFVHTFGGDGGADSYFVTKTVVSAPSSKSSDTCELNP